MRLTRLSLSLVFLLIPFGLFAQDGLVDSRATLSELNLLIAQYEARIKQLQAENEVLRLEMVKAGIQIPLVAFSGSSTTSIPTSVSDIVVSTGVSLPSASTGVVVVTPPVTSGASTTLTELTRLYGKDVSGFVSRINQDWPAIRSNYGFPAGARLAGYEFVQSGSLDHVFADIVVGTGTTGVYDIKILYQFEKSEYKRKLIGLFIFDPATERYTTKSGTNPFAGVSRTFVRDPFFLGSTTTPTTALPVVSTGTTTITPTSPTVPTPSTPTTGTVSIADITKAYNEKRYLSTISLSNTYLETNAATKEILNIRYRTYFIIGKYSESLAELTKVEQLGALDKQTACNAQVIATYSKNQTLVDKYAALCKK